MIEHLRGRETALEQFGWTGPEAEVGSRWCVCIAAFSHGRNSVITLMPAEPAFRFVQTLVDRRMAVESEGPVFNGAVGRAGYRASQSTGRWGSRTSVTGARPVRRL